MVRRERGQLVLIAAILVATAILGAVVLLNAVHSSPNVKAQSDAQSLLDTEQMTEQIHNHVRTVFFATSTSDGEAHQPYAVGSELGQNVTEYNRQLGSFVSTDKPVVASVEYNAASSATGGFVGGDAIPQRGPFEEYISGAESLPYLNVTVAEDADVVLELYDTASPTATPDQSITLDGEDTDYQTLSGTGTCNDVGPEPDGGGEAGVTVELENRTGEIRDADGDRCAFTFDDMSQYTVRINGTTSPPVEGSFAVAGVTPSSVSSYGSSSVRTESGVIVEPAVEISYQTPSVSYEGEYTLFRGDDE
jgi:hypothetical protein